ncbi:hypothetical protein M973_04865 [Francisella orientalis LADL 07-285A]|nr:hypothetical protein M973_04865 [Francisella orientalis LADL 07-285A]
MLQKLWLLTICILLALIMLVLLFDSESLKDEDILNQKEILQCL